MSKTSDEIRRKFKEGDDKRDAGLTSPEDVVRYDDILYGEDANWQKLDVYRPQNADGEILPVIISVHGGGWVYGDKERYQYYCMSLAQRGFAVVNFTYRLSPEFKFPAPIEDCNLVVEWIFRNSKEYGFDTKHIFAVGDSAGGHQLGLYAAICTNPEYAKNFEFKVPEGFVPTALGLNCGAYYFGDEISEETRNLLRDYLPNGGTKEEIDMICVTNHITKDFPPTFFMTSTGDFLKEDAFILSKELVDKKVPFIFRYYGNENRDLEHVFHCNMKSEDAKLCNDEECEYFKSFCK